MATPDCRRAGAADVWWACEANRVFTWGQFPDCGYTCDVHLQTTVLAEHLKTHHKIEDGVHHFKIPNYVALVDGKVETVEGPWMHN
ncbi:unnamed protein product [Cylicostephanus goldi]|uniref:Uncharacterized protein n=1 Tax=Cylicostephanus goldi TaxID=71465 RepID=A0A3P7M1U7_CYLGO|nr:unnamed protein product [Cylicostephanus goldi]